MFGGHKTKASANALLFSHRHTAIRSSTYNGISVIKPLSPESAVPHYAKVQCGTIQLCNAALHFSPIEELARKNRHSPSDKQVSSDRLSYKVR